MPSEPSKELEEVDLEADNNSAATTATLEGSTGKPQVRFFSIGPSSYQVRCPLCQQDSKTETVEMTGALGQLSCLLSALSCCFPIFALTFVYSCLQSRLKTKRVFCSRCGGHLGFHWRPT
ncbi:uncharacterized protein LOC117592096 [Drosophila guanche]|uniref:LITAF domain-containing protein n=1 Tax=Drosophila guanche TaxID=7266 RepID=A0A3B0IYG0_DROGU|nr:uncharacterized protein LOC117592096 [Drosophila guanche]SPP72865.1 Hypothetical predicted protein [Drosophila guanche]